MRVIGVVPSLYDTSPGQRFRIEQWMPYLESVGIHVTLEPFESPEMHAILYSPGRSAQKVAAIFSGFGRRVKTARRLASFDAAYVFRESSPLGPALLESHLDRIKLPYVFDFDDAIFVPYRSVTNGYMSLLKYPPKTRTACRLATHVMAGNRYLADYAREFNSAVTVVPTTIDLTKYTVEERPTDPAGPVVIGWSGSHSTAQYLDTAVPALAHLVRTSDCRVRVIGAPSYSIPGVEVDALPWVADTEVDDLRTIDIGIMPMPDDPWSRGKCGLKALQYMALAIPTVCSPVGVNAEIIQDGENGFLASSESQWIDCLSKLVASRELRQRLGAAGRRTVEERFDGQKEARRVASIFQSLVATTADRAEESSSL